MRVSDLMIARLKKFENCRLSAYRDSKGVPTIGYGHTKGVKMGMVITKEKAEELLREDLAVFEAYVSKNVPKANTQGRFDALVDFCYNCGTGNYAKSTLKKYIDADRKDYLIQKEFIKWTKSGGVELGGLVSRRIWEADRWMQ